MNRILLKLLLPAALLLPASCGEPEAAGPPAAAPFEWEGAEVHGAISPEQLRLVVGAALAHPEVAPPVISVTVVDEDRAEVHTGEVRGPLDAGGATVLLTRVAGVWTVTEVVQWIS